MLVYPRLTSFYLNILTYIRIDDTFKVFFKVDDLIFIFFILGNNMISNTFCELRFHKKKLIIK